MGEVIWAYCFEDERKEAYFYGVRNSPETEFRRERLQEIRSTVLLHFPLKNTSRLRWLIIFL